MATMSSFSSSSASRGLSLRIAGLLVGACLVFALTALFAHQHHHLDRVVKEHAESIATMNNVAPKWDAVWDIAQHSKTEQDFIQALRASSLASEVYEQQQEPDCTKCKCDSQSAASNSSFTQAAITVQGSTASGEALPVDEAGVGSRGKQVSKAARIRRGGGALDVDDYKEDAEDEAALQKEVAKTIHPAAEAIEHNMVARWRPGDHEDMDPELRPVDGGPPPMSVKLAHSLEVNKTVIVTWANNALLDFVLSWVKHMRKLDYPNFLVGAMDKDIGRELVKRGIPSFAMYEQTAQHSGVGADHLAWGGESFHKMGRQKIALAKLFLSTKLNVLLVDVDVVVLGDVLTYFRSKPFADILVSSDQLHTSLEPGDNGLEIPAKSGAPMNIGIMFYKYSERTLAFVEAWLDVINNDAKVWDQNAFNELARAGWDPVNKLDGQDQRVWVGFNGSLNVGVLPVASFSGGHTFFIQRLHEVHGVDPLMVHCTFQYGANIGKRNRMREAMIFEDEESYYTGEQYIKVNLVNSPSLSPADFAKLNYTQKKAYNVRGLKMQLESVYAGLGLAAAFNRTIIVPKLACYCDRYWAPLEDCRLPGADQERLPFVCPMDYVLDPIGMTDEASELKIRWREYSFLDNPRCPESVKRSKLTIYINPKAKATGTEKWSVTDGGTVLVLPPKLDQAALEAALTPYRKYQIWEFTDAPGLFTKLSDPKAQSELEKRIARLQPVVQPDNM